MDGSRDVEFRLMTKHEHAQTSERDDRLNSEIQYKDDFESYQRAAKDTWGSRLEFILAIIGYTVGMGNIWRFPMKCANNGGGAFLIVFVFFMLIGGGPLYYIEVCIGQFFGKAAAVAFELCPLFKGLGYMMVFLSFNYVWYYMSITGWIQYYLVNSFTDPLPWTTCTNWWNTELCQEQRHMGDVNTSSTMITVSPATEFWLHNVLRKSDGLESMGKLQWHLVLSNFIGWALVVAALIKGVRSMGKVVYVTATAPYILLTVLLVRVLTLDGSVNGVLWFITPDFNKLSEPQVWLDAAIQAFYSLGLIYGGPITMASYNRFSHKSFSDVVICVSVDIFTAFYAGLVVFGTLGFIARKAGLDVEDLARSSGPGLAFVAYPEAISHMPLPQLWAVLFFLTLITMAFDTAITTYENVVASIYDMFPTSNKKPVLKFIILLGVAVLLFLLGLPLAMNGGIYILQLADWYLAAFAVLFGGSLESFIVCWIYGSDRMASNIEMMTGRKCSVLLRVIWGIPMTFSLTVCSVVSMLMFSPPDYGDGYVYQPYAIKLGIIYSVLPFLPIVFCMVQQLYTTYGSLLQRICLLLRPSTKWEPADEEAREIYRTRPYHYENSLLKRVKRNFLGDKGTPCI